MSVNAEWKYELSGRRKLWARLRRRPWKWSYYGQVEIDPTPIRNPDGTISYSMRGVGPLTREEN